MRKFSSELYERGLLSAILVDNRLMGILKDVPAEVFDSNNASNWGLRGHILALHEQGLPISIESLIGIGYKPSDLKPYIDFFEGVDATKLSEHTSKLKDLLLTSYAARKTRKWLQKKQEDLKLSGDILDILAKLESEAPELSKLLAPEEIGVPDFKVLNELIDYLEDPTTPEFLPTIFSGIKSLDAITEGISPGQICVIAAQSGIGKSALVTEYIYKYPRLDWKVLLCSLEMSEQDIEYRLLSRATGISTNKLRVKELTEADKQAISARSREISTSKGYLRYICRSVTVEDLCSRVRKLKKQQGLDLLVLDYIGLISSDNPQLNAGSYELISHVSNMLRKLAAEEHIAIILVAQLNRNFTDRKNKRPVLSDLRGSGDIGNDASKVIMLHAPEEVDGSSAAEEQEPDKNGVTKKIELYVVKNRNGRLGSIITEFQGDRFTYYSEPDEISQKLYANDTALEYATQGLRETTKIMHHFNDIDSDDDFEF